MLQLIPTQSKTRPWQKVLAEAVKDPKELLRILELPQDLLSGNRAAQRQFPLRVPRGYVARMEKGNPNDPLLRQVLPIALESMPTAGFEQDPVGDQAAIIGPGLIQKYHGRALVMTTGACAIHCRYCFRRHFPYAEHSQRQQTDAMIGSLQANSDIEEIILSGGDPLSLGDQQLIRLITELDQLPQLKRLRIHTRQPIVLPERINHELLECLSRTRLTTIIVVHCNHANEIDDSVRKVLKALQQAGVRLFNQSVLLRGVNDEARVLVQLSEALFEAGVTPYYLHMLDRVQGAAHFEVSESVAKRIMNELRSALPGYLLPTLVREVPQTPSKQPL